MRRHRIHAHARKLARKFKVSLSVLSGLAFIAFFFYDGPLALPWQEVSAEAEVPTINVLLEESPSMASVGQPLHQLAEPKSGVIPAGFQAEWRQVSLDNDQVRLQMLRKPFHLAQTSQQLGGESFEYASYVFEQMAQSIHNPKIANELQALSLQAQAMGNQISHASSFRFAGPPNVSMEHLQVRSSILYYLKPLNRNTLSQAPDSQFMDNLPSKAGTLKTAELSSEDQRSGEMLQQFTSQVEHLLRQPDAQKYPQTLQLVSQESNLLKNVAEHLSLRWESTRHGQQANHNIAVYLKVYPVQSLPAQTNAAVIL